MKNSTTVYSALFTLLVCSLFALSSYAQVTETYCSTDVPVAIPVSGQADDSVLNVPDLGEIENVIVKLQIDHTFRADLDVTLTSPEFTTLDLFSDVGGSGDDFGDECLPMPNFILDDSAALNVTSFVSGDSPVQTFSPEEPLSTFNGQGQAGQWTLSIFDDAGGDSGSLNCWCLEITRGQPQGCCVIGGSDCLVATEDECSAEGGAYQGDGTTCDDVQACSIRPIPTMSEWGMIAFAGILGVSGLIFLMLRRRREAV